MKFKIFQLITLNELLSLLTFKGESVLICAMNLIVVREILQAAEYSKTQLVSKYTDGQSVIDDKHPNWGEFSKEYEQLMNQEVAASRLQTMKKADIDFARLNHEKVTQEHFVFLFGNNLLE